MKFFSSIISMLSDVNGEMRGCQQCFFCDRVCLRISLILKLCDVGPGNTNSGKNKSLQALGNQDISANVRVSGRICGLVKTQGENPRSCLCYTSMHCGCWLSTTGQPLQDFWTMSLWLFITLKTIYIEFSLEANIIFRRFHQIFLKFRKETTNFLFFLGRTEIYTSKINLILL